MTDEMTQAARPAETLAELRERRRRGLPLEQHPLTIVRELVACGATGDDLAEALPLLRRGDRPLVAWVGEVQGADDEGRLTTVEWSVLTHAGHIGAWPGVANPLAPRSEDPLCEGPLAVTVAPSTWPPGSRRDVDVVELEEGGGDDEPLAPATPDRDGRDRHVLDVEHLLVPRQRWREARVAAARRLVEMVEVAASRLLRPLLDGEAAGVERLRLRLGQVEGLLHLTGRELAVAGGDLVLEIQADPDDLGCDADDDDGYQLELLCGAARGLVEDAARGTGLRLARAAQGVEQASLEGGGEVSRQDVTRLLEGAALAALMQSAPSRDSKY